MATYIGTNGSDSYWGGPDADHIEGLGGGDLLNGNGGDDEIFGGDGNDNLHGGEGNDLLEGGAGNDLLAGEDGIDTLRGQAGDDRHDGALSARIAGDWQASLDALRSGGTAAVPELLEPKADKADTPPTPRFDASENVWQNDDGEWITTFPPPPGFDGYEKGTWDGFAYYERACTAEEARLIEAHQAAMEAKEDAELTAFAEEQRDSWFAKLRAELADAA